MRRSALFVRDQRVGDCSLQSALSAASAKTGRRRRKAERPALVDCVEKPGAEIEAGASLNTVLRGRPWLCGRWGGGHWDQLGHLAEVLGGGGEEELVSCAVWTSQAQAVEF